MMMIMIGAAAGGVVFLIVTVLVIVLITLKRMTSKLRNMENILRFEMKICKECAKSNPKTFETALI